MIIHKIHNLSNNRLISLLKTELESVKSLNLVKNYHPDYANLPENLFYILNNDRYSAEKGAYYVIEEDNTIICSAGWNEYELETTTALLLTRMFVNKKFRTQYYCGRHILPRCIDESLKYARIWMTCNEYNKSLYMWFQRSDTRKSTSLYNNWPEIYKKFKPVGIKNIYYTNQYVVEYRK